jgi:hypothetical protein
MYSPIKSLTKKPGTVFKTRQEQNMKIISPGDIKVEGVVILSWPLNERSFLVGKM